ncbi:hypothetical protein L1049_020661 [Liquidambar formosana]|uniref:Pectinesterase inhibitor domain-containing protein n=1 Tax=Liquidambar formosana TaxID=63359 RepID=A0AAP0SD23_LIQFO
MEKTTLSLLLLLLPILYITGTVESVAAVPSAYTNFIKVSCNTTRYPALCVESLSAYSSEIRQSPRQLAQTALSVSLARAQTAKTFVSKVTKFKGLKRREYEAVKDCMEEIGDAVDRLSKSIQELKSFGSSKGQEFLWHMSNVETWVSAALTDENTCVEGFVGPDSEGSVQSSITARVVNVAQVISNALAFVNQFAGKH